jgi:hypothetical protein
MNEGVWVGEERRERKDGRNQQENDVVYKWKGT